MFAEPSVARCSGVALHRDGWPSGLRRTPGKRVYVKSVTRVRIPPHPFAPSARTECGGALLSQANAPLQVRSSCPFAEDQPPDVILPNEFLNWPPEVRLTLQRERSFVSVAIKAPERVPSLTRPSAERVRERVDEVDRAHLETSVGRRPRRRRGKGTALSCPPAIRNSNRT